MTVLAGSISMKQNDQLCMKIVEQFLNRCFNFILQLYEVYSNGLKRQFHPEEHAEEQRLKLEEREAKKQ